MTDDGTAIWHETRQAQALAAWQAKIPPALAVAGDLDEATVAWAMKLASGEQAGNLLLVGNVGAGKTWTALHAIEHALANGWAGSAEFVTTAGWREVTGPPADQDGLRKLRERGVIILDDPGAIRLGDWDLEHLYAIADYRWGHRLPVIVTTNVPELRPMLGERVASRLADRVTVVRLTGTDRRREHPQEQS